MERRGEQPSEFEEMVRFGTVSSVDLAAGRIVVQSGEVETSSIRWVETRAGKTRTWSPPSVGEQVLLLCPSGEIAGAIAFRGVSQEAFPYPGNSLRELIQFDDGAVIAYDPEAHQLDVELPDGATIVVKSTGGVSIDASTGGLSIKGDVAIEGDVSIEGKVDATGDVKAGDISLQQHKHGGVTAGGGTTGLPQ